MLPLASSPLVAAASILPGLPPPHWAQCSLLWRWAPPTVPQCPPLPLDTVPEVLHRGGYSSPLSARLLFLEPSVRGFGQAH